MTPHALALVVTGAMALPAAVAYEWWVRPRVLRPLARAGEEAGFVRALRRAHAWRLLIVAALCVMNYGEDGWLGWAVVVLLGVLVVAGVVWPTYWRSADKAMHWYV